MTDDDGIDEGDLEDSELSDIAEEVQRLDEEDPDRTPEENWGEDAEKDRFSMMVPKTLKEAFMAEFSFGGASSSVRSHMRRVAFGEQVEQHEMMKMELKRKRDEVDLIDKLISRLQGLRNERQRSIARLEERVDQKKSRESMFEGHVEQLETQLLDGVSLTTGHSGVKKAAHVGNRTPEEVIQHLRDRNPEVPDHAYEDNLHGKTWTGVSEGDEEEEDVFQTREESQDEGGDGE